MICTQESLTCFCWHLIPGVFMLQLYEANTASCQYQRHIASSRDKCSSSTSTTATSSTFSICTNSSNTPISPPAPPHSPSALPPTPPIFPPELHELHQLHHLHLLHYFHQLQNSSRCFVFLPLLSIAHCSGMYCTPWCPYCFSSVLTNVRHNPLLNTAGQCNLPVMILASVVSTEWHHSLIDF